MALTKVYQLYAVKLGSTLFNELQDASIGANVTDLIEVPVGGTLPLFAAANGEKPEISFGTYAIETLLGLLGLAGGDAGIAKLLGRKIANKTGPVAVGSSAHASWTASASLGLITQITAGNRQRAMANVRIVMLKNGSTAALVYSGTSTVDSYSAAAEHFVLGPISLDGTVIEGTNDFQLALNPVVEESEDNYESEPIFAAVRSTQPVITFTTTDPSIWTYHNTEIGASTANGVRVNLVKMEANKLQYSAASYEHILLTAGTGKIRCESVGGSKQLTRVVVVPVSPDNSTAPVVATVDSAVTTS